MRKNKQGFYQSKYIVENKEKFINDKVPLCRSSWEHKYCYFLDHEKYVIKWGFEKIIINYINPIDGKQHRYITDFYFESIDNKDNVRKFIVEVKPRKQIFPPKEPKNNNRKARNRYIYESATFVKNLSKWEAADKYCKKKGYKFKIVCLVKEHNNEVWKVYSLDDVKKVIEERRK